MEKQNMNENGNNKGEQSGEKERPKMKFIQPSEEMKNVHTDTEAIKKTLDSLAIPLATMVNNINTLEKETERAFMLQIALGIILSQAWLTGYTKVGLLEIVKNNFFNQMQMSQHQKMQQQFKDMAEKMAEESEEKMKKNPYIT